jgi:toxin-antitoxin system PIN domain toxin
VDFPDINILITAYRPDTEHHKLIKRWLEDLLNAGHPLRIAPMVEVGFLRIVTHPHIFDQPSSIEEATGFLTELTKASSVKTITWNPNMRNRWLNLCRDLHLRGNDCNDAMLAAIALDRNLRIVSFDKGFARFPRLQIWNPAK